MSLHWKLKFNVEVASLLKQNQSTPWLNWAIKKCKLYLSGLPHFDVITDHNPLKNLFNVSTISEIENPKVQNYRIKLMHYKFTVHWRKGKDHSIPDALSRAPVDDPEEEDLDPIDMNMISSESARNVCEDLVLTRLKEDAKNDQDYKLLLEAVDSDFVKHESNLYVKQFQKIKDELSIDEGLILRGCRIVIPKNAIKDILNRLHSSHQGIEKTKRRARQTVYWPGFNNDIQTSVESCMRCQELRPSLTKEPLIQDEIPSRPFEMATSDLFSYDSRDHLIYADRYSGYPLMYTFAKTPSSTDIMKAFRVLFSLVGVPNKLRSDNGPQYRSENFKTFLRNWGVEWAPSSSYNPRSNGHAEMALQGCQKFINEM